MDLQPNHQEEATSSSISSLRPHIQHQPSSSPTETRALRSSARVKAAKQKERDNEIEASYNPSSSSSLPEIVVTRNTRSSSNQSKSKRSQDNTVGKGKATEGSDQPQPRITRRCVHFAALFSRSSHPFSSSRRTAAPPLTINEPVRDSKGKKRAAPESSFDEESAASTSSAKRPRTSSYSLRSRTDILYTEMPKKTK
jgi:E3 ubiquitin-protein ligase TRIP12